MDLQGALIAPLNESPILSMQAPVLIRQHPCAVQIPVEEPPILAIKAPILIYSSKALKEPLFELLL